MWSRPLVGGLVWLLIAVRAPMFGPPYAVIEALLGLAPLVVVPLGMRCSGLLDGAPSWLRAWSGSPQLVAGVAVVLGGTASAGEFAAWMSVPWLLVTLLWAVAGGLQIVRGAWREPGSCAVAVAPLFLPVGAAWLVISRLGLRPMDFSDVIVLLTAVHFHFAGFAAALLTGLAARTLHRNLPRAAPLLWSGVVLVLLGPPLIAVGFTTTPAVQLLAASTLALGLLLTARFMFTIAWRGWLEGGVARILLALSALCVPITMAYALSYAWCEYSGEVWVLLPAMVLPHGAVNALGFATCGLLAWRLGRVPEAPCRASDDAAG